MAHTKSIKPRKSTGASSVRRTSGKSDLDQRKIDALWADHFSAAINSKDKLPVGDGWLTLKQIQARTGRGEHHTHLMLRDELRAGRMEKFAGSQKRNGDPKPVRQTWYRPRQ